MLIGWGAGRRRVKLSSLGGGVDTEGNGWETSGREGTFFCGNKPATETPRPFKLTGKAVLTGDTAGGVMLRGISRA